MVLTKASASLQPLQALFACVHFRVQTCPLCLASPTLPSQKAFCCLYSSEALPSCSPTILVSLVLLPTSSCLSLLRERAPDMSMPSLLSLLSALDSFRCPGLWMSSLSLAFSKKLPLNHRAAILVVSLMCPVLQQPRAAFLAALASS